MSLYQQNQSTSTSTSGGNLNVIQVKETPITFKIVGNFKNMRNGKPTSVHQVFGNCFVFNIDGNKKYVFRRKRPFNPNDYWEDPIFKVSKSLKDLNNKYKHHPESQDLTYWMKQLDDVLKFLKARVENLVLIALPEDPEIRILDAKPSLISALFDDSGIHKNMIASGEGDVLNLGTPENSRVNGWVRAYKQKTGPRPVDVKYHIEKDTQMEEVSINGAIKRVPVSSTKEVHQNIYKLSVEDIPDTNELTKRNVWEKEEERNFAAAFNFPDYQEWLQNKTDINAMSFIRKAFKALPQKEKDRINNKQHDSEPPAQTYAQSVSEPQYQPQKVVETVQQPQQHVQQPQQPVQQWVPNQQVEQPVHQERQQPVQQQVVTESDIDAMLTSDDDDMPF